jgi:hypothetical protein
MFSKEKIQELKKIGASIVAAALRNCQEDELETDFQTEAMDYAFSEFKEGSTQWEAAANYVYEGAREEMERRGIK